VIPLLIAALAIGGDDQFTRSSAEISAGKRVVAAIKGKAEFEDADFVKPLTAGDKAALRRFAGCKVRRVRHTGTPVPGDLFTIVENPNEVGIGFDCKGVPYETPAGISLRFQNGKIVKVETHNADLMRPR
jgi:hypothetical protein